jgi:hypothetical protein
VPFELKDPAEAASTRWIKPFASDPDVEFEMVRLTSEQTFLVYDRIGIKPGQDPKNNWAKWLAAQKTLVQMAVKGWKNVTHKGKDLECNDQTKPWLLEHMVVAEGIDGSGDGDKVPLYRVLQDAFQKAEDADEKN